MVTKKEKEKLAPIINAADYMALKMEKAVAEDEFCDSKGKTDVTAIKGMTSAMKELVAVITNVNELPTKAERESAEMSREKFEMDKKKYENDSPAEEIRVIVQGAEEWCE